MLRFLKRMFAPKPLTESEQAVYAHLAALPYAVAKAEIEAQCRSNYKVAINNRGIQKWISMNAKRYASEHSLFA